MAHSRNELTNRLIRDDDGHWYVITVAEEADFELWVQSGSHFDYNGKDFNECRVNGPGSVVFADWIER